MASYTLKIADCEDEFGPIEAASEEEAVRKLIGDIVSKYPAKNLKVTVTKPPGGTFEATEVNVKDIEGGNARELEIKLLKTAESRSASKP